MTIDSNQKFHFEDFTSLDSSENIDFLIESMETMFSLNSIRYLKTKAIQKLNPKPGQRILEVGCGHGFDAAIISDLAFNKAEIYAVDASQKMIELAIARNSRPGINYIVSPIFNTTFDPEYFDLIYADRFLVSHQEKIEILRFLFPLLKSNGKIVINDVDAESIVFYPYNEITKMFLENLRSCFVNPFVGRELHALLLDAGFKNISVEQNISMIQDLNVFKKIFELDKIFFSMIEKGLITAEAGNQWLKQVENFNNENKFLYSVNIFTANGIK